MISKCVQCNFYIFPHNDYCPNCGIPEPTTSLDDARPMSSIHALEITGIFWIVILAVYFLFIDESRRIEIFLISLLMAGVFGLGAGIAINTYFFEKEKRRRLRETKDSLSSKETLIKNRIQELNNRAKVIESVLGKFDGSSSEQLQAVKQKLLVAQEIVNNQLARYYLQSKKIVLVRLQNSLAPFLYNSHSFSFDEAEKGFQEIDSIAQTARNLQEDLNSRAKSFPPNVQPEKEHFLTELNETEVSCQKLREALLTKQAVHALEGVAPFEDSLQTALPNKNLTKELAKFNIQVALTDFSDSFDELEAEYQRLKSESDISRQLEMKVESL